MAAVEPDTGCSIDRWENCKPRVYECRIWLCPEPDGGYSVVAPLLPGVASQGSTEEEAINNIREAFQGAAAEYLASDGGIPWSPEPIGDRPRDAREKRILVHV